MSTVTTQLSPQLQAAAKAFLPTMEGERARLAARAAIGAEWDGRRAANDNSPWPLLKALRSDRGLEDRERLIATAQRYRSLEAAAAGGILWGDETDEVDLADGWHVDQRTAIDPETGEVVYKGERRVTSFEAFAARKAAKAGDDRASRSSKVPQKWEGDSPLLAAIDAKPHLARLRDGLGPLRQPFESAIIHGATLESIGAADGFRGTQAAAAGKALVLRGLRFVAGYLETVGSTKIARHAG